LNNTVNDESLNKQYSQLFYDDSFNADTGKYVYTLKSGEYFMYANESKTSLSILGQGTKIETETAPSPTNTWRCEVISYDDLLSYGIQYITENNYWYTLPTGTDVWATEMQFYQLGPGTELKFHKKDTNNTVGEIVIGRDEIHYYLVEGESRTEINSLSLADFTISYATEGSSSDVILADKNTPELAWDAYSMLNINCDKSKIQYLNDHQIVHLKDDSNNELGELKGCCIVSSESVDLTGGQNVDARVFNYATSSYSPVSFAKFQLEGIDDNVDFISTDLAMEITLSDTSIDKDADGFYTKTVKFKIPDGEYILKASLTSDVQSLIMSVNGEELESIVDADNRPYNVMGYHYLKMSIESSGNEDELEIKYKLPDTQDNIVLILYSPYRYKLEKYIGGDTALYSGVMNALPKLDMKLFDYTYDVPDEDLVSNPLASQEFVNPSHLYNKYTICMWNLAETVDGQTAVSITNNIK
jgi:hypothetical protein